MSNWPTQRKRTRGRRTGLIDDGQEDAEPIARAFDDWPPPGLTRVTPTAGGFGQRAGIRVRIRGEDAGSGDDTMILGEPGLFPRTPDGGRAAGLIDPGRSDGFRSRPGRGGPGGRYPGLGPDRPVPVQPWCRHPRRTLAVMAGLIVIAVAGFLGVPPLLAALGIGSPAHCARCQLPIPSSAPIGSGPATATYPGPSAPAPHPGRLSRSPSASAARPPQVIAPRPSATTPGTSPLAVTATYTATPTGGGSFTAQITVANPGPTPVTSWQLVVALPGDSVSSVQNAEFTDDDDVLFLTATPYDLSIAPGTTTTVTIDASGSVTTPAVCSFNQVACL